MELFRQQVVKRRANRLFGEVALSSPISTWWVTGLIGVIVTGIIATLLAGSYARKEIVPGWIKPDRGLARIVSPHLGTVELVHVIEGQQVKAGDSLVTMNLDTAFSEGDGVFGIALLELENQIVEAQKQIPLIEQQFLQEEKELKGQLESGQAELVSLNEQIVVLDERIETADELLQRYVKLAAENLASAIDVAERRELVLSLRQTLTQVSQQIETKKGEMTVNRHRLDGLPVRREAALSEKREHLSGLRSQKAQIAGQGSIIMKAPVAGRVAALPVVEGQSMSPQELAVALLPQGGQLEAELFVPTRAAGFIKIGQTVRLQFDAFPFQRFGIIEGQIYSVSRTIFEPEELPVTLGLSEPVYRLLVGVGAQHIEAYGEQFLLQAGMTLKAHVIQEERKLWEVLLEPLLSRM